MVAWDRVTRDDVVRALTEYDRLGPERFFAEHGFAPTTTYELAWEQRNYPPKAILGTAYEFATGQRLASGDFEGGKAGAVKVLGQLGCVLSRLHWCYLLRNSASRTVPQMDGLISGRVASANQSRYMISATLGISAFSKIHAWLKF